MPPRRKVAKKAAAEIDLTLDSDSDAPPAAKKTRASTRNKTTSTPAAATASNGKNKGKAPLVIEDDDDEEEESADLALARQLQQEEDAKVDDDDDDEVVMQDAPVASGSGANARPRRNLARQSASSSSASLSIITPAKNGAAPAPPSDAKDPKTLLLPHRALFLPGRSCPCGSIIPDKAYSRPALGDSEAEESFFEGGAVKCVKCSKKICRGCWEEDDGAEGVGKHCAEQRAVILYDVLAALDETYLVERLKKPVAPLKAAATKGRKKAVKSPPKGIGKGTGYGVGNEAMMGMAGMGMGGYDDYDSEDEADYYEDFMDEYGYPPPPKPPAAKAKANGKGAAVPDAPVAPSHAKDLAEDKLFHLALSLISKLLPHPDSASAAVFDYLPSPALAPLLALSTVQDLLATLLRNDSVGEWTRRSEVYFGVLEVLSALSESESVLGVLFGERWEKRWSNGIDKWLGGHGEIEWERKEVVAAPVVVSKAKGKKRKSDAVADDPPAPVGEAILAPSLFSLLRRLVTQAEAFRKAAQSGEFSKDDVALLGLCGDVSACGDRCVRTLKIWDEQRERDGEHAPAKNEDDADAPRITNGKGKGRAIEAPVYTDAQYTAACRTLAYDSISLAAPSTSGTAGLTFPTHYYNKDVLASAASQRPHGGFVHLAKELAVLSTNLPPGIFLRVDEARIDVIKCIIAGPEGTPYAGGLFEFDIFVPLQYPQVPPKVWLKTTGAGAVRCLSILGTWPGRPDEMWQPGTSTILQVLISIQAMILGTTQPYFNEPGYGTPKDSKPSKDYNSNVSLATVKHAMIHWSQDQFKDGIWGDVISTHFTFTRHTISAQIKAWALKDKRMRAWTPSLNPLAGSHMLQPYPGHGAHGQDYYAQLHAGLAYQQALAAGQTLAQAQAARAAQPAVAAAAPAEKDLVAEAEEAMDKVAAWRTPAYFRTVVM